MGYTHYFKGGLLRELTKNEIKMVKEIIKKSGVSIKGGVGIGKPVITSNEIMLNGDNDLDEDYETFHIYFDDGFNFCKTAHKPYDNVCVAILIFLEKSNIIKEWSSDGCEEDGDFDEGRELLEKVGFIY
jgi:hypothetical protein